MPDREPDEQEGWQTVGHRYERGSHRHAAEAALAAESRDALPDQSGRRPRHWNYAQAGEATEREMAEQKEREAREQVALAYVEDLVAEAKRQGSSDEKGQTDG